MTSVTHTTHRTQQVNKVKGFDENAAQNLSNFNALNFFEIFYYFGNKIGTALNWSQLNTWRLPNANIASTLCQHQYMDVLLTLEQHYVVKLFMSLLSIRPGRFLFQVLRLKMTSWACFVGSGLKLIFHCRAHSFILERSLFNRLVETIIWTTENSDVSSTKSFTSEFKASGKSLLQIKNVKGQRIDPSRNVRFDICP